MFTGLIGKQMMIQQRYVPATCTLHDSYAGPLIYNEIRNGRSPCDGCNEDRSLCKGSPKDLKWRQKNELTFFCRWNCFC